MSFLNSLNGQSIQIVATTESVSKLPATYSGDFHLNFAKSILSTSGKRTLTSILGLISTFYGSISNWELVIFLLSLFRDFGLMPPDMMNDPEGDLIPASVRQEFETSLAQKWDRRYLNRDGSSSSVFTQLPSENATTLQFLGKALFGSLEDDQLSSEPAGAHSKEESICNYIRANYQERLNSPTTRWDGVLHRRSKDSVIYPGADALSPIFSDLSFQ